MATIVVRKQQEVSVTPGIAAMMRLEASGRIATFIRLGSKSSVARWGVLLGLMLLLVICPEALRAQAFRPTAALSFTKAYAGANPLPQVFTAASNGTNFAFSASVTSITGGSWLTITQGNGCCYTTPQGITVTANPVVTLAAGTYTAQILLKSQSGTVTETIPVTLTIEAATAAFLDQLVGGLTFSMQTNSSAPPAQSFQIRNGGVGTLAWTATASTSDGGSWLTISAASGTAPSFLNVTVNPTKLPGLALTAGTFTGQVVVKASSDTTTIPITMTVGDSIFRQINPLVFTKLYAGGNPLAQVITTASTGANFSFSATTGNSTGGTWLSITQGDGCCYTTPQSITVTANPAITLAAGTYTSEVIIKSQNTSDVVIVPVTLVIEPSTASFFGSLAGELAFGMETDGTAPPVQTLSIQNAGTGALAWTAVATTSDGGNWLTLSAASGSAPAFLNVGVNPANFPGTGLTDGTFTGQIILQTGQDRVTVPISVTVGESVFRQVNPLNFTKPYAGGNPLPQVITIASTGASIRYSATAVSSTGGAWLTITHGDGCCYSTPDAITVTANPAVTLAAGTYFAEVIAKSQTGNDAVVVPVSLTIAPTTTAFFDALPGELSFAMVTKGTAPPTQSLQIRNGGAGTLAWTATKGTSDGGNWLTISGTSGTAPSFLNVGIVPANLPGGGLTDGTFTGQVVLQTGQDRVTVPIVVSVGPAVFQQINPLNFTKPYAGANPLPQVITLASTGANIRYAASAVSSTGGNWLTITNGDGCCYSTPNAITVTANPAVTLVAGTYSAEIIIKSQDGSVSTTVPVTLSIEPATATFFDSLPGEVTFLSTTTGGTIPSQTLQIRNAGVGVLDWTVVASTSDGGHWLTVSPASSAAPSTLTVVATRANLPGKGLVAGTFTGQVILQTGTDRVTVPIAVTVGDSVFKQLPPISFTKPYQGANPAAQLITVTSTATSFSHSAAVFNATGGNWLTITHGDGCCYAMPDAITVTANPVATLAPGVYVSEIIFKSQAGDQSMAVPVTLTVTSTAATALPKFTPAGGNYTTAQSVAIADTTIDAAIYYTLDGTTPTTASKLYTVPISVAVNETIKAIAVAPGYASSAVATAVYTFAKITPTPIPTQTVSIADAVAGAVVYYTTNGTTPTTSSTKYTGPVTFSTSEVLKFIAVAPGYTQSAVKTVSVTVQ